MKKRPLARRLGCLSFVFVVTLGFEASAEEAAPSTNPQTRHTKPQTDKREAQDLRVDFGMVLQYGLAASPQGGAAGSLGPLGSVGLLPFIDAAFEVHLKGPVWALLRARGNYSDAHDAGIDMRSWSAAGDIGIRVEVPTFRWLDIGGYALVGASGGRSQLVATAPEPSTMNSRYMRAAAVLGVAGHFHPTALFGVRLSLDLVGLGHDAASYDTGNGDPEQESSSNYAALMASPGAELTFSF